MNTKTLILVLILLGMVAYGGYYLGNKTKETPTPSVAITTTPTVDEVETIQAVVKAALDSKHGASPNQLAVTVSKIEGNYAQGGVKETAGGAMWFAVKVNGIWKLAWDGNGTISCSLIDEYPDFPKTMIPECWNEITKKNVIR
jgi:hypothetical protein